jgi:CHAT domain-containing protein
MTLASLQEQAQEIRGQCVDAASAAELQQVFAEIWGRIRQKSLYGGQPSSGNSNRGVELAQLALFVATHTGDGQLFIEAWCMMAYTLNANEQYAESVEYYRLAIGGLERTQDYARAARNRLGYLTALSMIGRYDEAVETGLLAKRWFLATADHEGYARLCVNLGNVYQRLDQPALSLEYHENAIHHFRDTKNDQALAQIYLNAGNALGSLGRFEEADQCYSSCEEISSRLALNDLDAQARYNRAYLYFLRGRNMEAVEHFGKLRLHFKENASKRHAALCDLDETEIYLQLNLSNDAARLARCAMESFVNLNMRYEHAKAGVFLAIALTQNRQFGDALQVFRSSQLLFEEENNQYWVALVKLYRAEVLYAVGRLWEARSLALSAYDTFSTTGVVSKRVVSMILLGRVELDLNRHAKASSYVQMLLQWMNQDANPLLLFPGYAFCAYAAECAGKLDEARNFYQLAAREIENRRTHLGHDELRIAFFPEKQGVYEALLRLTLDENTPQPDVTTAYQCWQRAKSTAMADLAAHHLSSIRSHGGEALLSRIGRIRDELNNSYLRLRSEKADLPSLSNASSIQIKESELLSSLRELSEVDPEYVSLQNGSIAALEQVQALLPPDTTVIEFFTLGNEVIVFLVTSERAEIFRHLSPLGRIRYLENQLRSDLLKVSAMGSDGRNAALVSPAFANAQLAELYGRLIQPIRDRLRTTGLIIVPHGVMHYIPFAALFDGENHLLDCYDISYSPSSLLLTSSLKRKGVLQAQPLILGKPLSAGDQEFNALQRVAPDADWCTGDAFVRDRILKQPLCCDFVHISTDVEFRHDNPMFSCIRCADSWITAVDLYSMSCQTNLMTLSGNMSGINPATGGESRLAIIEAMLYAGARSVLTSLWNVEATAAGNFMEAFYGKWRSGGSKCAALRHAATTIRRTRIHPFFWAPYTLTGQR